MSRNLWVSPWFTCWLALSASATDNRYRLETSAGDITIELLPQQAPMTVAKFRELMASRFYDGTFCHRAIPGYFLQCGGSGGSADASRDPGFRLQIETSEERHVRGAVALARDVRDPGSGSSQFFIVLRDAPMLDEMGHTIFARVVGGLEVADRIASLPADGEFTDRPLRPVLISKLTPALAEAVPTPVEVVSAPEVVASVPSTVPPSPTPAPRLRVRDGRPNVRGGPGTQFPVVGRVSAGDLLPVLSRDGDWYEVALDAGRRGYLRQDMVDVVP